MAGKIPELLQVGCGVSPRIPKSCDVFPSSAVGLVYILKPEPKSSGVVSRN